MSIAVDPDAAFRRALDLNIEDPKYRVRPLEDRLLDLFRDIPLANDVLREMGRIFLRPIFDCAKLDPDALPTLAAIRQMGIRTAIVSNTPWGSSSEQWTGELRRHGLSAAVDAVVFCVDVGWRKPEPRIFQHALSRIGVEARAAAFVGDDPRQDIAGAEQSGLCPILLDPGGDTPNAHCRRIRSLTELTALLPTVATP
jgi:putative hydrolase of the HAD superfamily